MAKSKFIIKKSNIHNIVNDGAIGSSYIADQKIIPALILKNDHNNDLETLINIHTQTPPGDVRSTWVYKKFISKFIYLNLEFYKPLDINVAIQFDISKHYALIDGIIYTRCVYLISGIEEDRISSQINSPKILVEVPSGTTLPNWQKTLESTLIKKFKKRGCSKKEALSNSVNAIKRQREIFDSPWR